MDAEYWATPGRTERETFIHCKYQGAQAVAVVDGSPDETYNLPEEVLESIKDRLYAICVEELHASAEV